MRFHRGRVYFVRWDRNPACASREAAANLPGARRINDVWYTPVQPYRSGETTVDADVLCKCDAYAEESKHLLNCNDLIPADFLYDVAQGRMPVFFSAVPNGAGSGC